MSKSQKGSQFERDTCKLLSLWASYGKRDDIFWRSAQSGGRATQRAKQGKSTANSEGDIAAIDEIGIKILDNVLFELKRGYKDWSLQDALEYPERNKPVIGEFWAQAVRSNDQKCEALAKESVPALIVRKDKKESLFIMDGDDFRVILKRNGNDFSEGFLHLDARPVRELHLMAVRLEPFLNWCMPEVFMRSIRKK